jgi:hypothetical protein
MRLTVSVMKLSKKTPSCVEDFQEFVGAEKKGARDLLMKF